MDGDEAKEPGPDGASGAAGAVSAGASCEDGSAEPPKKPHKRMRRSAELDAVDKESASAECQDQELKHMKGNAEREAKRIERESKRLKKHQEEALKAKKRKEKEEAKLKRQADIQRQAKFMERLFKRKPDSNTESSASHHLEKTTCSKSSGNIEQHAVATTSAMDCTLSQPNHLRVEEFWEGHVARWRKLPKHSKFHHWGVRRSAKVPLFPDLKLRRSSAPAPFGNMLTQTKEQSCQEDSGSFDFTKLLDELKTPSIEKNILSKTAWSVKSSSALLVMKLLQFDGSSRPAYYGTWRKKSSTVSARKPFQSDPKLNYGIESDEEDDAGERLSDFDEDDEKDMNEHESTEEEIENDFVVPNGYLSEDEIRQYEHFYGKFDETCSMLTDPLDIVEEPDVLLQREKFLHSATERQKPLVISNLDHRKLDLLKAEDVTEILRKEGACLQARCMKKYHDSPIIDVPDVVNMAMEDQEFYRSNKKSPRTPLPSKSISDSDMPEFVKLITSCHQGMRKLVGLLQERFPHVSKVELKSRVREIAEFTNNHWQVKKDILDQYSLSPAGSGGSPNCAASVPIQPSDELGEPGASSAQSGLVPKAGTQQMGVQVQGDGCTAPQSDP